MYLVLQSILNMVDYSGLYLSSIEKDIIQTLKSSNGLINASDHAISGISCLKYVLIRQCSGLILISMHRSYL